MHVYIFLFILGSILALDPAHLKPGALTAHLGRVSLVEDVIWIRYPYSGLSSIPRRLERVIWELEAALAAVNKTNSINQALVNLTNSRLTYMKGSINHALENYYSVDTSIEEPIPFPHDRSNDDYSNHRSKRGFVDGFGKLFRMLFGTAMHEDVKELEYKYNLLSYIARANNKAIVLNSQNIARLDMHVKNLASYANTLRSYINKIQKTVENIEDIMIMNQALSIMDTTLNSLLRTNLLVIQNLVDAARGRVTSSLFPVKDLLHALKVGKLKFNLIPLFDSDSIQFYYPLLESVLTSDAIVIHVPFRSSSSFEVHQIEPFPFEANGTVMTIDLPPSVVLVAKDFSFYAVGDLSDLEKCQSEYRQLYHCPAHLFAFLPITGGVCEVVLTQTNASKALSLCPYKKLVPKPLFHQNFFGFNYFYFSKPIFVSIICPNHTEYKEVTGHLAVLIACYLRSTQLSTFPSKLHHGFTANLSNLIIPMESLNNLNFSSIRYVTNTLSEFRFSDSTGLKTAIVESLPQYLRPPMHYTSMITPIVVIVLIMIPLIYVVKKIYLWFKSQNTGTTADV